MSVSRVHAVANAAVTVLRLHPPTLEVTADGTCPSTGWSDGELTGWHYITPPSDGVQDFDFVATSPTGIVSPVLSPIVARPVRAQVDWRHFWGQDRPLKGVRIHAQTNKVEALLASDQALLMASTLGGDFVPWPWSSSGDSGCEAIMVGKSLRTYRTGDGLTKDFNPNRCNVELDPATNLIVSVRFG